MTMTSTIYSISLLKVKGEIESASVTGAKADDILEGICDCNKGMLIRIHQDQPAWKECPYCGGNCPNEPKNSPYLCDEFVAGGLN